MSDRSVDRGTLHVVATPIGNLSDASPRSLEVLRNADLIACEDTRTTRTLLAHYGISTRTVALRVLYQGRESEQTLTKIDPLLVWLMMHREGMLHVDGEGFYEGEELIFEME